jgi:hypothetical protein
MDGAEGAVGVDLLTVSRNLRSYTGASVLHAVGNALVT